MSQCPVSKPKRELEFPGRIDNTEVHAKVLKLVPSNGSLEAACLDLSARVPSIPSKLLIRTQLAARCGEVNQKGRD
jgi:hypothetical protein